jgi:hypothetical protein
VAYLILLHYKVIQDVTNVDPDEKFSDYQVNIRLWLIVSGSFNNTLTSAFVHHQEAG